MTIGEGELCFAHAAYRLGDAFRRRVPDRPFLEVRDREGLLAALPRVGILVVSGLWRNSDLDEAPGLRFIQCVSAGTDQFDKAALARRGVALASAQGGNERAVAEHALALVLTFARKLHLARDDQARRHWRGMIGDPAAREVELGGRTAVIVGFGRIGQRIGTLCRAFGMHVIGVRREAVPSPAADRVVASDDLDGVLPLADYLILSCPLTQTTRGLIGERRLRALKPGAILVNVARGAVVDEPALIDALAGGILAGAGLDCFAEEPLPPSSPFWTMPHVVVTSHTAGETSRYEDEVVAILLDNLGRLERGEPLRNAIVPPA